MEIVIQEKKQVETELESIREKLREVMKEKIELQNNFNLIQKHEMHRLNELETKFNDISEQYIICKEQVHTLARSEAELKEKFQIAEMARKNYKEQCLQLK